MDLTKQIQIRENKLYNFRSGKGEPTECFECNDVALSQIGQRAGIDSRTVQRLQRHYPKEFDQVINAIWQKEPSNRMIRTFDNPYQNLARAFLSDKFKTFDNSNLLQSALPELMESTAQWKIQTADITDKNYI